MIFQLTSDMEATESKTDLVQEERSLHNCCTSTINISYQIVLQDHNYGAPPPQDYSPAPIVKQEPKVEFTQSGQYPVQVGRAVDTSKGSKTLTPRAGSVGGPNVVPNRTPKVNGANATPIKQQQKLFSNNAPVVAAHLASPVNNQSKIGLPPLPFGSAQPSSLPGAVLGKIPGDLNSHLYASVVDKPEEPRTVNGNPPAASGGLVSFLGNINEWLSRERLQEKAKARAELTETFNDDSADSLDSPLGIDTDNDGEETETAPECEGEEDPEQEESITRCICKFGHDDGYMICCDRCSVWQHVDCMGLDRTNIPDEYLCEQCHPRRIDRARARAVQYRKRQEFRLSTPPPASGRDRNANGGRRDDFIDVEKTTPRKQLAKAKLGAKTVAAAAAAAKNLAKGADTLKGRKVTPSKWKRKSEKLDETEKEKPNPPRKRKISRGKSSEGLPAPNVSEGTPVKSSQAAADLLLQWIEHYEEAVTNHYSPELRARVATVRPTSSNVPFVDAQFVAPSADHPVYKITNKHGGYKTLEALEPIKARDPIIEVRGKYMLTNQLRPYKTGDSGTGAAIRPSPHIIYIQLYGNSDSTSPVPVIDVCVDGRSYGNEARFAWQSCQPNAEVKLSIEKGSVHLYLVAKMNIGVGEEITLPHETRNPLPCTFEGCPYQNARTVQREFAKGAAAASEKRRRRRTNSAAGSAPVAAATTPVTTPTAAESSPALADAPVTTPPPRVRRSSSSTNSPAKRQQRVPSKTATSGSDEQPGPEADMPSDERAGTDAESGANKDKKLSREERKMEAIMKAFERMEKAEQRRQEALAKQAHRKDHRDSKEGTTSGRDEDLDVIGAALEEHGGHERRPLSLRKRKRGGRVRRSSSSSSLQTTRMRALSGEVQSGQSTAEDENQDDINDYASTAFRCPKTKKVVFSTWVADADGNIMKADQHQESGSSPSVAVPVCYMRNPISRSPTRSQRSGLRPPTLTSLKTTGSDSPDAFNVDNPGDDGWTAAPAAGSAGGSAKKRWLRQAISEETETDPSAGGQATAANEALDHVTPLKKRRFARASLSSETSFTPPSTPTQFCGFNETTPPEAMPTAYEKVREAAEEEQLTSSQSTTPECDELPPVHSSVEQHHETEIETVDEQELLDIPLPEMEETPAFFNGFHGPVFLPQHVAGVKQPEENYEETPKPTWEFRAPDAQFMRARTNSETCDPNAEQQQQTAAPEETPKPAKRKLSILEYRKRQQRLHSEDSDGPRDDSSSGGSKQGAGSPGAENEEDTTKTSPEAVDSLV